ncbi:MAG: hypothetical protein ACI9UO_002277 [Nitrospinales bacterium]|jgi:hypothetical protein
MDKILIPLNAIQARFLTQPQPASGACWKIADNKKHLKRELGFEVQRPVIFK